MYITTIEAINIAISAIQQLPESEENKQAIIRLTNVKRQDRLMRWTKEQVFEALDKWKAEHDRNPTMTNLSETDMPSGSTIQCLFDMKPTAFLNIYYPNDKPKKITSQYTIKSKQEWIDNFIEQFNKNKPISGREYDLKRDKGTPTWGTIARYVGVTTWTKLLILAKVDIKHLRAQALYRKKQFTVNSTSSLYEKLEALLSENDNSKKIE